MQELLILPASHYAATVVITALATMLLAFLLRSLQSQRWRREQRNAAAQMEQRHTEEAQKLHLELHTRELSIARLSTELDVKKEQLSALQKQIAELIDYRVRCHQMEARLDAQEQHQMQERKLLDDTKSRLFKEFELAAGKLFETTQQQFSQHNRTGIEQLLKPFREQLRDFHARVEDVYHKENSQRNQLVGQIVELQRQARQVSQEANNLAAALKGDNQFQGSWGEMILERILEQSGLQKGREYETQKSHSDETGKRFKPDVIVHLPEGKHIVIDSKVSLLDFQRFCDAEEGVERQVALKRHVDSLRAHIRQLSEKKYEHLDGITTLDFVFIFVPVEPAYSVALQAAPDLFKEASDKNIVLVSPSSLMVALRTVDSLWRREKQNRNAEAIARSAGKLYDQFVMVIEALEEHGKQLERARDSYQQVHKRFSGGRGNLIRRVESLRDLGAKTNRSLPVSMKSSIQNSEDPQNNLFATETLSREVSASEEVESEL